MKLAVNTARLLRNVPIPNEIGTLHNNALILDMGSGKTRLGFSGDDSPRLTLNTVVGLPPDVDPANVPSRFRNNEGEEEETENYEGYRAFDNAYNARDVLKIHNVLEKGVVKNWEGLETLFLYVDDLLGISKSADTPVMITEKALIPREQRDKITEILFEKLKVPSVYFALSPVMGMYASGRTTGLSVEMGYGTCQTMPVFEGFGLFHATFQLDIGGDVVTKFVGKQLSEHGFTFQDCYQYDIWQFVKEKCCSNTPKCKEDFVEIYNSSRKVEEGDMVSHNLPDGTVVTLPRADAALCCEVYFDPSLMFDPTSEFADPVKSLVNDNGRNYICGHNVTKGLHIIAKDSIRKCDQDISSLLCSNVVLNGGASLPKGLPERFNQELQDSMTDEKVRVYAATERGNAAFVGGSILASLPTFQSMWVTRADYQEYGSSQITTRNCF